MTKTGCFSKPRLGSATVPLHRIPRLVHPERFNTAMKDSLLPKCESWARVAGRGMTALLACGVVLSGCALPSLDTADWFPSLPGFSKVTSSAPTDALAQATPAAPATPTAPATPALSMEDNCPTVDIRQGAGTLAEGTKGQPTSANDVRYQLTFTQVARQCALTGQTIKMRVGVQGRAVAGPAGAPSQVEVPLRYAVVREGPEPITVTTKFKRIALDLPPGNLNALFTDIEADLTFPLPPIDQLPAYVVYVGFDAIGDRTERRPPAKKGKAK